jgi:hypothetical protein
VCRICFGEGHTEEQLGEESSLLVQPCSCSGSNKYVHETCLLEWLVERRSIEARRTSDGVFEGTLPIEPPRCQTCDSPIDVVLDGPRRPMAVAAACTCAQWMWRAVRLVVHALLVFLCVGMPLAVLSGRYSWGEPVPGAIVRLAEEHVLGNASVAARGPVTVVGAPSRETLLLAANHSSSVWLTDSGAIPESVAQGSPSLLDPLNRAVAGLEEDLSTETVDVLTEASPSLEAVEIDDAQEREVLGSRLSARFNRQQAAWARFEQGRALLERGVQSLGAVVERLGHAEAWVWPLAVWIYAQGLMVDGVVVLVIAGLGAVAAFFVTFACSTGFPVLNAARLTAIESLEDVGDALNQIDSHTASPPVPIARSLDAVTQPREDFRSLRRRVRRMKSRCKSAWDRALARSELLEQGWILSDTESDSDSLTTELDRTDAVLTRRVKQWFRTRPRGRGRRLVPAASVRIDSVDAKRRDVVVAGPPRRVVSYLQRVNADSSGSSSSSDDGESDSSGSDRPEYWSDSPHWNSDNEAAALTRAALWADLQQGESDEDTAAVATMELLRSWQVVHGVPRSPERGALAPPHVEDEILAEGTVPATGSEGEAIDGAGPDEPVMLPPPPVPGDGLDDPLPPPGAVPVWEAELADFEAPDDARIRQELENMLDNDDWDAEGGGRGTLHLLLQGWRHATEKPIVTGLVSLAAAGFVQQAGLVTRWLLRQFLGIPAAFLWGVRVFQQVPPPELLHHRVLVLDTNQTLLSIVNQSSDPMRGAFAPNPAYPLSDPQRWMERLVWPVPHLFQPLSDPAVFAQQAIPLCICAAALLSGLFFVCTCLGGALDRLCMAFRCGFQASNPWQWQRHAGLSGLNERMDASVQRLLQSYHVTISQLSRSTLSCSMCLESFGPCRAMCVECSMPVLSLWAMGRALSAVVCSGGILPLVCGTIVFAVALGPWGALETAAFALVESNSTQAIPLQDAVVGWVSQAPLAMGIRVWTVGLVGLIMASVLGVAVCGAVAPPSMYSSLFSPRTAPSSVRDPFGFEATTTLRTVFLDTVVRIGWVSLLAVVFLAQGGVVALEQSSNDTVPLVAPPPLSRFAVTFPSHVADTPVPVTGIWGWNEATGGPLSLGDAMTATKLGMQEWWDRSVVGLLSGLGKDVPHAESRVEWGSNWVALRWPQTVSFREGLPESVRVTHHSVTGESSWVGLLETERFLTNPDASPVVNGSHPLWGGCTLSGSANPVEQAGLLLASVMAGAHPVSMFNLSRDDPTEFASRLHSFSAQACKQSPSPRIIRDLHTISVRRWVPLVSATQLRPLTRWQHPNATALSPATLYKPLSTGGFAPHRVTAKPLFWLAWFGPVAEHWNIALPFPATVLWWSAVDSTFSPLIDALLLVGFATVFAMSLQTCMWVVVSRMIRCADFGLCSVLQRLGVVNPSDQLVVVTQRGATGGKYVSLAVSIGEMLRHIPTLSRIASLFAREPSSHGMASGAIAVVAQSGPKRRHIVAESPQSRTMPSFRETSLGAADSIQVHSSLPCSMMACGSLVGRLIDRAPSRSSSSLIQHTVSSPLSMLSSYSRGAKLAVHKVLHGGLEQSDVPASIEGTPLSFVVQSDHGPAGPPPEEHSLARVAGEARTVQAGLELAWTLTSLARKAGNRMGAAEQFRADVRRQWTASVRRTRASLASLREHEDSPPLGYPGHLPLFCGCRATMFCRLPHNEAHTQCERRYANALCSSWPSLTELVRLAIRQVKVAIRTVLHAPFIACALVLAITVWTILLLVAAVVAASLVTCTPMLEALAPHTLPLNLFGVLLTIIFMERLYVISVAGASVCGAWAVATASEGADVLAAHAFSSQIVRAGSALGIATLLHRMVWIGRMLSGWAVSEHFRMQVPAEAPPPRRKVRAAWAPCLAWQLAVVCHVAQVVLCGAMSFRLLNLGAVPMDTTALWVTPPSAAALGGSNHTLPGLSEASLVDVIWPYGSAYSVILACFALGIVTSALFEALPSLSFALSMTVDMVMLTNLPLDAGAFKALSYTMVGSTGTVALHLIAIQALGYIAETVQTPLLCSMLWVAQQALGFGSDEPWLASIYRGGPTSCPWIPSWWIGPGASGFLLILAILVAVGLVWYASQPQLRARVNLWLFSTQQRLRVLNK